MDVSVVWNINFWVWQGPVMRFVNLSTGFFSHYILPFAIEHSKQFQVVVGNEIDIYVVAHFMNV